MDYKLEGNPCIFRMFVICNVLFLILGILIAALGIYISVDFNHPIWYNISFAVLGAAIIIVALVGHKTRLSLVAINFYLLSSLILFLSQSAFTIAIIAWKEFSNEISHQNAFAVHIFMIVASALIALCIIVGFYYRKSFNANNFKFKDNHSLSLTGVHALADSFYK